MSNNSFGSESLTCTPLVTSIEHLSSCNAVHPDLFLACSPARLLRKHAVKKSRDTSAVTQARLPLRAVRAVSSTYNTQSKSWNRPEGPATRRSRVFHQQA